MTLGGNSAQRSTVLVEQLPVTGVSHTREGVREVVFGRLYPGGRDPETTLDLFH